MPDTNLEQALEVAERLRHSVGTIPMLKHNPPLQVTVSIGVTASGQNETDLSTLVKQADKASYQAKNNGRNRVEAFQD